jgi:hypothetical protein
MTPDEMMDRQGGDHIFEDGDGGYVNISDYVWKQIVDQVVKEYEEE